MIVYLFKGCSLMESMTGGSVNDEMMSSREIV